MTGGRPSPALVQMRGREHMADHAGGRGRLVYLVAGDASADRRGADLMRALRAHAPALRFAGIGGAAMQEAGLASLFDVAPLRAGNPVPRLQRLFAAERAARDILWTAPDVLVTIEGPGGLALGVSRRVRRRQPGLPRLHYGAPSGIWRPGRLRLTSRAVGQVLTLLPFECPLLEEAGLACGFVGHPVADRPAVARQRAARYRGELGIRPDRPLVLMAPGTSRGQVRRLLPLFRRCLERVAADRPGLGVVVPVADGVAGAVEAGLRGMRPAPHLIPPEAGEGQKWLAMAAADLALTASGTVTIELAAAGTPMVICQRDARLTSLRHAARAEPASPLNLIAGDEGVPEFHGGEARVELVEPALAELLDDDAVRSRQLALLDSVMATLGRGGEPSSARAARAVLAAIESGPGRGG